ncbi:alpha/beta fold hydrolase [Spartinivicinus ruber]|uniref:alpha/beta fold hydrolase n=1 Tax=Spartinivicinus ruber TaxID=2683272 RepID=UPI0013D0BE28|nr:alpha/beta fold hydrolase [Spartinivicinus ruber]
MNKAAEKKWARYPDFDIQYQEVAGQQLRVAIRPGSLENKPPLLLLNGIGGSVEFLQPLADELTGVEIIAFDVPGAGGSPAPLVPYRFAGLSELTAKLLNKLNYGQVNVMGYSWGGALAQQFVHDFSRRCRKLVLAATTMGVVAVPGHVSELLKMAWQPKKYFSQAIKGALINNYSRHASLPEKPPSQGMVGFSYQLLAGYGWTSFLWLSKVRNDTLLLAGEKDTIVPAINMKLMARLMANADLKLLSGDHFFPIVTPKQTADLILSFCDYH